MIERFGLRPYRIWDKADKMMAVMGTSVLLASGFCIEQTLVNKSSPSAQERKIADTEGIIGGILIGTGLAVMAVPFSGKRPDELRAVEFGEAAMIESQIRNEHLGEHSQPNEVTWEVPFKPAGIESEAA